MRLRIALLQIGCLVRCRARIRTMATHIKQQTRKNTTQEQSKPGRQRQVATNFWVHKSQQRSTAAKSSARLCREALRSKRPSSVGIHDRIAGGVVFGCRFCCVREQICIKEPNAVLHTTSIRETSSSWRQAIKGMIGWCHDAQHIQSKQHAWYMPLRSRCSLPPHIV